ncbi:MAG: DUF2330 domain-containing protein [Gammaproteobacteria bacterium]|nr:DUF2330 domain-containing protein [Gammaproteobacteria bacterium]
MRSLVLVLTATVTVALAQTAQAFCGFYVAKADTSLFNRASQVVLVRDGNRTVLTMANDFEGDVKDFAVVIPVPSFIEREQINVADKGLIDHLDAYTAPRLVEYFDPDPCKRYVMEQFSIAGAQPRSSAEMDRRARALGVTIEASYTVGEYDILILSGKESKGLIRWLNDSGYKIPKGANKVVGSYLKQDMRFFVAKVNLEEQKRAGVTYLRPLQIAFESNKFMLPIRLGTLNADGMQELYVYTLTKTGRVETTNYRTVKLPSNTEVPEFVQAEFSEFYRSMFEKQVEMQDRRAVFLEYAWDMAWCDPCAADPLSADQLRKLGVFWVGGNKPQQGRIAPQQAQNVFVTRLHVRYDAEHFPEDLMFQETGDRQNFQGRYVIRHPFKGESTCDNANYQAELKKRQEREAQQLANLTGWDIDDIRTKIPLIANNTPEQNVPWWKQLWN